MENLNPVYVVDKLVIGQNHIMFNGALISLLADIYRNREVIFVAEEKHVEIIKQKNQAINNIRYNSFIETPLPQNKLIKVIPWLKKKIGDLFFVNKIYQTLKQFPDSPIFFTCLSTTSLYYATYKFRNRNTTTVFVLHGEIEFLFKKDLRYADMIKGWLYKKVLVNIQKGSNKGLVLSKMIREKLAATGLISIAKLIAIEHPISGTIPAVREKRQQVVRLGHIGVAMRKKNSGLFFELADCFERDIVDGRISFELIGRLDADFLHITSNSVQKLSLNNIAISQEDYEGYIQSIDYAVFVYDDNNYVFRVSGSVMDAIFFKKPIIALNQEYIKFLFEVGGNIGFLCNDMSAMKAVIKKIIENDSIIISQYTEQQKNMEVLRERFLHAGIKKELSKQLFN